MKSIFQDSKVNKIEAFQFYVDNMPDWFFDKVCSNDVVLIRSDYKRYSISEALCHIIVGKGFIPVKGGDYIVRGSNGNLSQISSKMFKELFSPTEL